MPRVDTRGVWQFLLSLSQRPAKVSNATIRTKGGALVGIHLVTLRNVLWGRHDMSAVLDEIPLGTA